MERARLRFDSRSEEDLKPYAAYRDDPNGFYRDVLGCVPWFMQREINRSVVVNSRTGVATSTGPGKTWNAARLMLWWQNTRRNAVTITTANTWIQIKNQLWREAASAFAGTRRPLLGRMLRMEYEIGPKWFALGLSSDKPESMAGWHAHVAFDPEAAVRETDPDADMFWLTKEDLDYFSSLGLESAPVLVIADEASGIEDRTWEALDGLLTNPNSRMLAQGNPTRTSGRFHRIFHPTFQAEDKGAGGWETFHISAFDVPEELNIIGRDWLEDMARECGPEPENNPVYQVRVLGTFPSVSDKALYPASLLEAASNAAAANAPRGVHLGVDIARHGGDKCVAILLINGRVRGLSAWVTPKHDRAGMVTTARRIRALHKGWKVPARNIHLDVTGGWGWGPHDLLHDWDIPVDGVDFSGSQLDDWREVIGYGPRFANRRHELHWILKRALAEKYVSIPDPGRNPKYAPLWRDLLDVEHDYSRGEKFLVESKKEYRARCLRSPDYLDALLCALSRTDPSNVRFWTSA